ncbi:1-acyl-sn-glycerol-3-phosphate acyltransferase [Avibacterium sp. 21-595]|uniref:lysophospholipid acyltransferase family protein n=1 Tax=Avibacterium sp. 21-595 TaxID=2911527 RepID=UPI002025D722|nr:lysophospholipid acyltransferase family protein [Avibacterium sp. 21-595]URL07177.1 1-acyl-sn-glycerol-3-phosphate acyltransferase [Avibacterium sp. 21-595]
MLAKLIDFLLCRLTSFLTGVRPAKNIPLQSVGKPRLYYANHNSHGDFILFWVSLPYEVRKNTRPVAGADYWQKGSIRSFLAKKVFNMLLIERNGNDPKAVTEQISQALKKDSLIIFPEGTRKTDDDMLIQPFKSGLYYLAKDNPDVDFIPVWISNTHNLLPKGFIVPVPLLCDLYLGDPIHIQPEEDKTHFLARAEQALVNLNPKYQGA